MQAQDSKWKLVTIDVESRKELFRDAADGLALAFFDDPIFRFLAPRDIARRRLCELALDAQLRLAAPEGHCYSAIAQEGDVLGTICLTPPGRRSLPLRRILTALPGYFLEVSALVRSFPTMISGLRFSSATERLTPDEPHWYVLAVGVTPKAQGLGVGRFLLSRAQELARADAVPLALVTESKDLVRFYEHLGFTVARAERPHPKGPKLWGLMC